MKTLDLAIKDNERLIREAAQANRRAAICQRRLVAAEKTYARKLNKLEIYIEYLHERNRELKDRNREIMEML